jgi:tetratricopeptide (TPR) repeat protein
MWRLGLITAVLWALMACGGKDNPEKFLQEGFSQFQQQNYDGAIKNYELAIALGAKSPNAYNMLGQAYRFKFQQTHDPKLAESEIISFQKAVEIDPKYWAAMLNLGTSYYSRGDKAKAAVWFKKAMEINPHHPDRGLYDKMIAEGAPPSHKRPQGR